MRAATGRESGQYVRLMLTMIVVMQAVTCGVTLKALTSTSVSWAVFAAIVAATSFTSVASYLCTKRYYQLSVAGAVSSKQAATFGAIPGLVALLIYVSASLLAGHSSAGMHVALVLVAVLPTTAVWLFVSSIGQGHVAPSMATAILPSVRHVALVLLGLGLLTIAATRLRADIAAMRTDYAAVIVVILNSLASLLTTLTRARFLRQKNSPHLVLLTSLALCVASAGLLLLEPYPLLSQIFWLLGVQGLMIVLIEVGRRV